MAEELDKLLRELLPDELRQKADKIDRRTKELMAQGKTLADDPALLQETVELSTHPDYVAAMEKLMGPDEGDFGEQPEIPEPKSDVVEGKTSDL